MGKVVQMKLNTTLDLPVERVLDGARECVDVIVIGMTGDDKPYWASSTGDCYKMLWMVEQFKLMLLANELEDA